MNTLRMLSGIKPSGTPHLGNYLGMIKPALALQKTHQAYYFIADYHALTTTHNPQELKKYTMQLTAIFAALEMDFDRHAFFRQSDVPQVTELAWLLNCITPHGLLERAHAYKDAQDKGRKDSLVSGVFFYPVLMAADILIYDAHEVPVGKDQQQHLEIARDIAQRFNHHFGETFVLPQARITKEVATIPGIDGRKMSKSYGNELPLFSSEAELKKRVMRIQTDSLPLEAPKDPEQCNVFQIFRHFASLQEQAHWAKRYREGGLGYGEIKQATFHAINTAIASSRERYFTLMQQPEKLTAILTAGAAKASTTAHQVLARARKAMGLPPQTLSSLHP